MSDNKQLELPDKIGIEITSDSIWIGAMKEGVGCKKVDRIICSLDYKTFYSEKVRNLQLAIAERIVDSWNTRAPTERKKKLEEALRWILNEYESISPVVSELPEFVAARAALEGEG